MAAPEVINVTTDYEDPMKFESLCMECMNNVRSQAAQTSVQSHAHPFSKRMNMSGALNIL